MEQKNLEELYHKGELEWEEGEYTVCRGFHGPLLDVTTAAASCTT